MIDITQFTPTGANVLLQVEKEDYVSVLTQKVRTSSGGIIEFDFDHYMSPSGEFKVSRELMKVISVGPKCKFCQPGDMGIIDYTIDEDDDLIVYEDETYKYFCIPEDREIVKESHGVYNARGAYSKIYDEGDCIRESSILGVIRDEKIICNENFVIFREEDANDLFELSDTGIWIPKEQQGGEYMLLTIEFVPEGSPYKPGDKVFVYQYFVFTKNIQAYAFLMANEQDISAVKK